MKILELNISENKISTIKFTAMKILDGNFSGKNFGYKF